MYESLLTAKLHILFQVICRFPCFILVHELRPKPTSNLLDHTQSLTTLQVVAIHQEAGVADKEWEEQ